MDVSSGIAEAGRQEAGGGRQELPAVDAVAPDSRLPTPYSRNRDWRTPILLTLTVHLMAFTLFINHRLFSLIEPTPPGPYVMQVGELVGSDPEEETQENDEGAAPGEETANPAESSASVSNAFHSEPTPEPTERPVREKPVETANENPGEKEDNRSLSEKLQASVSNSGGSGNEGNAVGVGGGAHGLRGEGKKGIGLKRHGGSGETEDAVHLGLGWLASVQDVDGSWDSDGYMLHYLPGASQSERYAEGVGLARNDLALTGLCLLAYTGAGYSDRYGPYQTTIERAREFLIASQRNDGGFGLESTGHRVTMYGHAIATLALIDLYLVSAHEFDASRSKLPPLRIVADRARQLEASAAELLEEARLIQAQKEEALSAVTPHYEHMKRVLELVEKAQPTDDPAHPEFEFLFTLRTELLARLDGLPAEQLEARRVEVLNVISNLRERPRAVLEATWTEWKQAKLVYDSARSELELASAKVQQHEADWAKLVERRQLHEENLRRAEQVANRDERAATELYVPMRRALIYLLDMQGEGGGWDYDQRYPSKRADFEPSSRNDLSISGWAIMALVAAREANFEIPAENLDRLGAYLHECTRDNGDAVYANRGTRAGDRGMAMLAVSNVSRRLLGEPVDSWTQQQQLARMSKKPPVWSDAGTLHGSNMYYWYYGTIAMMLSKDSEDGDSRWRQWNIALKRTLLDNQIKSGARRGSFDPVGHWAKHSGGRVYSTALCVLNLEIYYRYEPEYLRVRATELKHLWE